MERNNARLLVIKNINGYLKGLFKDPKDAGANVCFLRPENKDEITCILPEMYLMPDEVLAAQNSLDDMLNESQCKMITLDLATNLLSITSVLKGMAKTVEITLEGEPLEYFKKGEIFDYILTKEDFFYGPF